MSKPGARRYHCDDCELVIDGETYTPHEGEWVDVVPVMQVGDMALFLAFQRVKEELEGIPEGPEREAKALEIMVGHFDDAVSMVSSRVVDWNWTDMRGVPLPSPATCPDVLRRLATEELFYLVALIQGGSAREKKGDTKPLPITSSATRSTRRRA